MGAELEDVAAEVDRQLGEQRAQCEAFASRSGILTAVTALLTALVGSRVEASGMAQIPQYILWIIGIATVLGVLALCLGRLLPGPSASRLSRWTEHPAQQSMLDAKILALEANARALLRTELVFLLQAVASVLGIVLLLYYLGGEP